MRLNKKVIAGTLIAGLCMSTCMGCSSKKTDSDSSTTDTIFTGELEKNVTIHVLENDTAIEKGYLDELIKAFNEKYKDQGITAVDANLDQYSDLAKDGPYGYGPDVLYQANDAIMQYAEGKHILPLDVKNMECYSQIPEAAWKAYETTVDGETYTCGIPVNVQAPMLYYRKDLLPDNWESTWDEDKNNVPDMLESFNKLYEYSQEVHSKDASKYGFMSSVKNGYFSAGFLFTYGAYVFGDNNTNAEDIGLGKGEAVKGAKVLKQLASIMNEETIDDTIQKNAYTKLADGTYFATISTPDTYTKFLSELQKVYEGQGKSKEDAEKLAKENLVITDMPKLPESGDLTDESATLKDMVCMGGVNGYAISSYTKCPNASLAFVEFATSYEMVVKRNEMLGIAPAREDAAKEVGGLSDILYSKLDAGTISIMPSIQEVSQLWTPLETYFSDLAKDAFRKESEMKYTDDASYQSGLDSVSKNIHDAIFTLSK